MAGPKTGRVTSHESFKTGPNTVCSPSPTGTVPSLSVLKFNPRDTSRDTGIFCVQNMLGVF
jgi:hypothetical protein